MIADDAEVDRLHAIGATNVLTKAEFAAAIAEPVTGEHPFVDPEEIAVLLFTSGTTSEPKAAILRHRHLVSYIISSVEFLGCEPTEAQLICVPSYHIAGIAAVLSSLYAGRRIMYLPAFEAGAWVQLAADEHVTHAMVVPTMLGRILNAIEETRTELPSLRHLSYGGGRMPLELVERTLTDMPHIDLVNAYGLTETSFDHRHVDPRRAPRGLRQRRPGHPGPPGLGRAAPPGPRGGGARHRRRVLQAGEKGEIWVRGEQVAGEYVGNNVLTDDGWFRTRDAGWFDEHGFLYVDGRLDDVIVRGAENISPGEIEEVLMAHPPSPRLPSSASPTPNGARRWPRSSCCTPAATSPKPICRSGSRSVCAPRRCPCVIAFRDELPYSPTGKLLRRVLRDELSDSGS